MTLTRFGLALAFVVSLTSASYASLITQIYDVKGSGFTSTDPRAPAAPYDPVDINFTVTLDNSQDVNATTSGLTINSNTLPFSSAYEYNAQYDTLTLATSPFFTGNPGESGAFYNTKSTYGVFINNATQGRPEVSSLTYTIDDGSQYGQTYSAAVTTVTLVSAVPLPASAPMFGAALLALAGFGYSMSRWVAPKSKKANVAA